MPMDGVMLGFVARQLDTALRDGRVDRVIQPEKDEIHLMIRAQGVNHRLVLSAAATGSNPVGCTIKTLDVLRAVEGFSLFSFPMRHR